MSKYKVGDKVVVEITDRFKNAYGHEYYSILDSVYSTEFIDKKSEPLRNYTEPLEAKIHRQAAEITRLLVENEKLKAENGNVIWEIEQAFDRGCNEAWELARKIFDMETNDIEDIFIETGAWNLGTVLDNNTYPEAAAKVEAWEKAKIKVGDIIKVDVNGLYAIVTHESDEFANVVHADGNVYLGRKDGMTKTGRHIDIDSFLKQIGEE